MRLALADRWAGGFVVESAAREGLVVQHAERTTSETFLELAPLVNAGLVELLDQPVLLRQLGDLQRSTRSGGRDRVEHRPGQHDDLAAAAALALVTAAAGLRRSGLRPNVILPNVKPSVEILEPPPQRMRSRSSF